MAMVTSARFRPSTFSPFLSPRVRSLRGRATASAELRVTAADFGDLIHNKVLVAATVASAFGQLAKAFTSIRRGERVDWTAIVRSGGMPSTHSASVVAAATSLGLERGFSDSVFGISVVYAAIVMYDSQGVRKEVGNHAKILNRMKGGSVFSLNGDDLGPKTHSNRTTRRFRPGNPNESFGGVSPSSVADSDAIQCSEVASARLPEEPLAEGSKYQLTESVGHTRTQVLAGALLGFAVSLMVGVVL